MSRKTLIYIIIAVFLIVVLYFVFYIMQGKQMMASLERGVENIFGNTSAARQECLQSATKARNDSLKQITRTVNTVNPTAIATRKAALKKAADVFKAAKASANGDVAIINKAKEQYKIAVQSADEQFKKAVGDKLAEEYIKAYNSAQQKYNKAVAACPK